MANDMMDILKGDVAGVPVWAIGGAGILAGALYLRRRQAKQNAQNAAPAGNSSSPVDISNAGDIGYPLGYPLTIEEGATYVNTNITTPPSQTIINNHPRPGLPGPQGPPGPAGPPGPPAPSPVIPPPPRPVPTTRTYNVVRGDTMWAIARRFGIPLSKLESANTEQVRRVAQQHHLYNPRDPYHWIFPGEQLVIPAR